MHNPVGFNRRLGKNKKKFDHRTLQFARYLPLKLPVPPVSTDHASRMPANIGMMGNDKYGDCTIAAAGHMVQSWTTYAERGTKTIPDSEIISTYLIISPEDQGANMLDVLNYWHKTGVGGDKIEAFAEVASADLTQAKLAIEYFGSLYIGMSLPDQNLYGPWTTPTGVPNWNNGHAVTLLAYDDSKQMFKVATWGEVWDMSYAWYKKYVDEAYAILNDISIIQASGKTAEGFDLVSLQTDLWHIGDPVTVEPVPVPMPPPVPPTPIPVPTPDPVPTPLVSSTINITGVGSAYWNVWINGVQQDPQHSQQLEAAQHAVNILLANKSADVRIKHNAEYLVTLK